MPSTRTNTPWRAWLALASQLGVAPHDFWRLSMREWRALATPQTNDTLNRAAFDELSARFPDKP